MIARDLRNTLASVEESADRASGALADALGDLRPMLETMARDVHETCTLIQRTSGAVQAAAHEHTRAARFAGDILESVVWGIVLGAAVFYAFEYGRDAVRAVRGLGR